MDYTTPSPRFSVNDADALKQAWKYLDENGYVVIGDILDDREIKESKDRLWTFLENSTEGQVQRNDAHTWTQAW